MINNRSPISPFESYITKIIFSTILHKETVLNARKDKGKLAIPVFLSAKTSWCIKPRKKDTYSVPRWSNGESDKQLLNFDKTDWERNSQLPWKMTREMGKKKFLDK